MASPQASKAAPTGSPISGTMRIAEAVRRHGAAAAAQPDRTRPKPKTNVNRFHRIALPLCPRRLVFEE